MTGVVIKTKNNTTINLMPMSLNPVLNNKAITKNIMAMVSIKLLVNNFGIMVELEKAYSFIDNYCKEWLQLRKEVRNKIDQTIEHYGYLETLAVSRL